MTHRCQSSPSAGCTRAACGKEDGRLQLAECNSIFSHSQANTAQYCAELCVCACIHGISQSCSSFPASSSQVFLSFFLFHSSPEYPSPQLLLILHAYHCPFSFSQSLFRFALLATADSSWILHSLLPFQFLTLLLLLIPRTFSSTDSHAFYH